MNQERVLKSFILKRIAILFFLLWAVATLVFVVIHRLPGDPAVGILGSGENSLDMARIRRQLHLDKPLAEQYGVFMVEILQGNLGVSYFNRQEVTTNIMFYFPNTIMLALAAMLVAVVVAVPMGTLAAYRENTIFDTVAGFISTSGLALPNFFVGPLLILFFSIKLGWLPVSGSSGLRYLVLPALTLGISMAALLARIVRKTVIAELDKPYVLFARSKGLSERSVFFVHVLKNTLMPVVTTMGMQLGALLAGAIVTETIFSWQGIGVLLVKSISRRDYPMIQGIVVFISFLYLVINFLVDLSYFFLNPGRMSLDR